MNWLRRLFARPCGHANHVGLANYYEPRIKAYVHLIECRDCGDTLITSEGE